MFSAKKPKQLLWQFTQKKGLITVYLFAAKKQLFGSPSADFSPLTQHF